MSPYLLIERKSYSLDFQVKTFRFQIVYGYTYGQLVIKAMLTLSTEKSHSILFLPSLNR